MVRTLAIAGVRGHYDGILKSLAGRSDLRLIGVTSAGTETIDPIVTWARSNGHATVIFDDVEAMLDGAAPDVLILCGPFDLHTDMAIDAIRRGIHVLVEKTAAVTFDQLEALRATHWLHPAVHLAQMHTSRFVRSFFTAKQLIDEGAIGELRLINARKSYRFGQRGSFYHHRADYGGTIPWVGAHAIDWMLWMSGRVVESVTASHSARFNNDHGTMERSALCQFVLTGECFASISIDVFRPQRAPTHGDDHIRLVGTDGVLEVTATQVKLINADSDGSEPVPLRHAPTMLDDFVDHINAKSRAINTTLDLFNTTAACLLARESADRQRTMMPQDVAPSSRPTLVMKSIAVRSIEKMTESAL